MAQCYDWSSETQSVGTLPTDIWFQCPSGNTCCVGGSICLDHNLCHVPGSSTSTDGSFSSYYVARCSDPTYTSPDCQKVCDAPGPPDAVYNYTSQQWNCCGKDTNGDVSCNNPTSEIFQAPAPADLKELSSDVAIVSTATLAAGEKTSSTSSTSSSTTSSSNQSAVSSSAVSSKTQTPSSSKSTSPDSSQTTSATPTPAASTSSLSTGAKAGIGLGIALAIIAILVFALLFLRRLRRKREQSGAINEPVMNNGYQHTSEKDAIGYQVASVPVEKGSDADRAGSGYVDADVPRSELGSSNELVPKRVHEIGSSR